MRAPPLAVRVSGTPAIVTREETDESPEHDAGADEDHVRRMRGPVGIAEIAGGALDLGFVPIRVTTSPRSMRISGRSASLHRPARASSGRHRVRSRDAPLGRGPSGHRPVRHHHVQGLDRDVEQTRGLPPRPELGAVLHDTSCRVATAMTSVPANHRARLRLDDLALAPDRRMKTRTSRGCASSSATVLLTSCSFATR